jgi:dolichol-phosphate mannosyltransferase
MRVVGTRRECEETGELNPSILVIIATLNEEEGVGQTIHEINNFLDDPHLLVVDGRSIDGTIKIAKSMGAKVLFQKGLGKGDAILTAIEHLETSSPQYVVFIDADYTYPAEYLPEMIEIMENDPSIGMVSGNRFNSHFHLSSMNDIFYAGNRALAFIHNLLNGVDMRDPLTGLRVVRGEIIKKWIPKSKSFDVEVELNHHVERMGYQITEIPIHYRARLGEKKLKLRHGLTILKRIISESM